MRRVVISRKAQRLLALTAVAAVAALSAGITRSTAEPVFVGPVCAVPYLEKSGTRQCLYTSYEQCMLTLSGIGGYCINNPFYRTPAVATAPARRVRRPS